jgi:hypothetical protein
MSEIYEAKNVSGITKMYVSGGPVPDPVVVSPASTTATSEIRPSNLAGIIMDLFDNKYGMLTDRGEALKKAIDDATAAINRLNPQLDGLKSWTDPSDVPSEIWAGPSPLVWPSDRAAAYSKSVEVEAALRSAGYVIPEVAKNGFSFIDNNGARAFASADEAKKKTAPIYLTDAQFNDPSQANFIANTVAQSPAADYFVTKDGVLYHLDTHNPGGRGYTFKKTEGFLLAPDSAMLNTLDLRLNSAADIAETRRLEGTGLTFSPYNAYQYKYVNSAGATITDYATQAPIELSAANFAGLPDGTLVHVQGKDYYVVQNGQGQLLAGKPEGFMRSLQGYTDIALLEQRLAETEKIRLEGIAIHAEDYDYCKYTYDDGTIGYSALSDIVEVKGPNPFKDQPVGTLVHSDDGKYYRITAPNHGSPVTSPLPLSPRQAKGTDFSGFDIGALVLSDNGKYYRVCQDHSGVEVSYPLQQFISTPSSDTLQNLKQQLQDKINTLQDLSKKQGLDAQDMFDTLRNFCQTISSLLITIFGVVKSVGERA